MIADPRDIELVALRVEVRLLKRENARLCEGLVDHQTPTGLAIWEAWHRENTAYIQHLEKRLGVAPWDPPGDPAEEREG